MNLKSRFLTVLLDDAAWRKAFPYLLLFTIMIFTTGVVSADVLDRMPPAGAVPNPGTQQQELANITAPAPYNIFEFVVTCGACHSGTVDQTAGHFSNWAGSSMASAARDPFFRANQIGVNNLIKDVTGQDGAGNMCMRCHSLNGWYGGRFDPSLAGDPQGTTMIHSILASTDDEGVLCEACHRSMGNVTYQRADLDPNDPVWNMMAGVTDWPHDGRAMMDQDGSPLIAAGNVYGDTSLQLNDGMTYLGKYSGSVDIFFSDIPFDGSGYTGQTYGVYPPDWTAPPIHPVPAGMPATNSAGQKIFYGPDGGLVIHSEFPIGVPVIDGAADYQAQAISLEHPTAGDRPDTAIPAPVETGDFVKSAELCGSCHDLTVPVLNHGMPEQRTYTEWKFSDFGTNNVRCQDCHMPTQKHEYDDTTAISLNPDPALAGWFPYGKDRNPDGGTAFHKFAGANRDLPEVMKLLYPEVDLEVIGAETGVDPRVFPGMLSDRSPMWDRNQRNTELSLMDGVSLELLGAPAQVDSTVTTGDTAYEVQVKVTNTTGHRLPTGYPDGRRFWIELQVKNGAAVVYQSGEYDDVNAKLLTQPGAIDYNRALDPVIDTTKEANQVMVYERVTGTCVDGTGAAIFPDPTVAEPVACTPSSSLVNNFVLFDNRPLPAGFDYAALRNSGVKFWSYDPESFVPHEDFDGTNPTRYAPGQNFDIVTYRFIAPAGLALNARAELYWQTHTREFAYHLYHQDTSTVRPEGPPSIYDPNYPLNPNYLSDQIDLGAIQAQMRTEGFLGTNETLNDNWGGIAYAAWFETGKGAPFLVETADSTAVPLGPTDVPTITPLIVDSFTIQLNWSVVPGAEGYIVWVQYGLNDATADWDQLAVVRGNMLTQTALTPGKSFRVKVQPFNGTGMGSMSAVYTFATPTDQPLPPEALRFVSSTGSTITISWFDTADNEIGFRIQRQVVPPTAGWVDVADIPTPNGGGTGGVNWTDTGLLPGQCFNYRVAAYNNNGLSTWSLPVQGCTTGIPSAPTNLSATAFNGYRVDLTWTAATGTVASYRLERSTDGGTTWPISFSIPATAVSYSDTTVTPSTTYTYRLFAINNAGTSPSSNLATVTTPGEPPAAPSALLATASAPSPNPPTVTLTFRDNATNEQGFYVERALDANGVPGTFGLIANIATPSAGSGGTVTYVDNTVQPKLTYWYRVQAYNAAGVSAYSNLASVTTPGEIPEAPANLRVTGTAKNTISLAWTDLSTNELGFYLERSTNGTTWTRVATIRANTTSYKANGLTSKTLYYFRIQAYNADGVSAYSNTVSARTK